MTPKQFHQDYLAVCKMNIPSKLKVRVLSEILSCYEHYWKVIGITKNALKVFQENSFKKVSRMGVNRSHIIDRHKTYTRMVENPNYDCDSWWNDYLKHDKTVLSTSTENMTGTNSDIIYFDNDLFPVSGFAWRHGKKEIEFLKQLSETHE
jgi:hypothetical protein